MPSYFEPDLTGLESDYYKDTDTRIVFKNTQVIEFDVPVFDNVQLEVYEVGSPPVLIEKNVGWTVQPSDIDFDMMSRIKTIDPTFAAVLLKSITITKPYISQYEIQLKYNQIWPNTVDYAPVDPNNQVELTPTLIANMVEQLSYLNQVVLGKVNEYTLQSDNVKILEEDRDKLNPDNFITEEEHDVNTIDGIQYIRPIYGAFFRDSVNIDNANSSVHYVEGTDYEIIEADLVKTAATSNALGVYLTIKFITPIVGQVNIDYHAYGNTTDIATMKDLYSRLETIEEFLSGGTFVTPSNIRINPSIIQLNNKLHTLESDMRLLLQNGLPNYGDVSTGTALLKKVSSTDNALHWWSIATLYQVDGSNDFVKKDVFKFRLTGIHTGLMFECSVSADVDNMSRTQIRCLNSNVPDDILTSVAPQLRILYSNLGATYEGMTLQLGMKLQVLQETFVIEDMSGREGCWKLIPFDENNTPPEDTAVLLPDGNLVWGTGDPSFSSFIPFDTPVQTSAELTHVLNVTGFGNAYDMNDVSNLMYSDLFDVQSQLLYGMKMTLNIGPIGIDVFLRTSVVIMDIVEMKGELLVGSTKYSVVVILDLSTDTMNIAVVEDVATTAANVFTLKRCKLLMR